MTSTTATRLVATAPASSAASRLCCIDHGVLADDAVVCARCGSKPWDLTNPEHHARVSAYTRTALKTRAKNLALVAAVGANLVMSAWATALTGNLVLKIALGPTAVGAVAGAAAAWLLRPRAVHALERALRRAGR